MSKDIFPSETKKEIVSSRSWFIRLSKWLRQTSFRTIRTGILVITPILLLILGLGTFRALQSPLFLVRSLEIEDLSGKFFEKAPLDMEAISLMAQVPVGEVNLYDLDLDIIEKRLLAHDWIRSVRLNKKFPRTLVIAVNFRRPKALFWSTKGDLIYIDQDGTLFGSVDLRLGLDLPVVSGFSEKEVLGVSKTLKPIVSFIDEWKMNGLGRVAEIESIHWSVEHGYEAVVLYAFSEKTALEKGLGRTILEIGQNFDGFFEMNQSAQLVRVFEILSQKTLNVTHVRKAAEKKWVVRTAQGS